MTSKEDNPFVLPSEKQARYEPRALEAPPPDVHQEPVSQTVITGERRKNFPPCRPFMYHDINVDIPEGKRLFVRKNYISWYFHMFCLVFNAMALMGGAILGNGIMVFVWASIYLVIGFFITFWIYYLVYSAVRLGSSFRFVVWFLMFGAEIIFEILCAIGIPNFGGAGVVVMGEAFSAEQMVLGIFYAICGFLWGALALFNVYLFFLGRREYRELGGSKAAFKEASKTAVQTAYDNRQTIKEVVVENKDTIKQVALDNKDLIIQVAKDNKDTIRTVAYENRDTIAKVAIENKDTIFQNEDVVNSVFSKK